MFTVTHDLLIGQSFVLELVWFQFLHALGQNGEALFVTISFVDQSISKETEPKQFRVMSDAKSPISKRNHFFFFFRVP